MDLQAIAQALLPLSPADRAALMNQALMGFDAVVGARLVRVAPSEVVAELVVTERHTQPYGLAHGGVYATLGESACSVGAAISVMAAGKNAVGAENTTRFHRGCRPGTTLTVTARPVEQRSGGRQVVWEAVMVDSGGHRCATSRVLVAILDKNKEIAGHSIDLVKTDAAG